MPATTGPAVSLSGIDQRVDNGLAASSYFLIQDGEIPNCGQHNRKADQDEESNPNCTFKHFAAVPRTLNSQRPTPRNFPMADLETKGLDATVNCKYAR
jgi:hypothetical protein